MQPPGQEVDAHALAACFCRFSSSAAQGCCDRSATSILNNGLYGSNPLLRGESSRACGLFSCSSHFNWLQFDHIVPSESCSIRSDTLVSGSVILCRLQHIAASFRGAIHSIRPRQKSTAFHDRVPWPHVVPAVSFRHVSGLCPRCQQYHSHFRPVRLCCLPLPVTLTGASNMSSEEMYPRHFCGRPKLLAAPTGGSAVKWNDAAYFRPVDTC